jgi:hypothetical protein
VRRSETAGAVVRVDARVLLDRVAIYWASRGPVPLFTRPLFTRASDNAPAVITPLLYAWQRGEGENAATANTQAPRALPP